MRLFRSRKGVARSRNTVQENSIFYSFLWVGALYTTVEAQGGEYDAKKRCFFRNFSITVEVGPKPF